MTDPERKRVLPKSVEELEYMAGLKRTEGRVPTRDDIPRLERQKLPSWGRKRRKFKGP